MHVCADAASGGVIQWHLDYNACDVLLGQVHVLLNQVSHGAGMSVSHTASFSVCLCKRNKVPLVPHSDELN